MDRLKNTDVNRAPHVALLIMEYIEELLVWFEQLNSKDKVILSPYATNGWITMV